MEQGRMRIAPKTLGESSSLHGSKFEYRVNFG